MSRIESRFMSALPLVVDDLQDTRLLVQELHDVVGHRVVGLNNHHHVAPLVAAVEAHVGHVHPRQGQGGGHIGQVALVVQVLDHQGVVVPGEADLHPVQLVDHDPAAAGRAGLHLHPAAGGALHLYIHAVGVGVPQVHLVEGEGEPLLPGDLEAVGDVQIIGGHA